MVNCELLRIWKEVVAYRDTGICMVEIGITTERLRMAGVPGEFEIQILEHCHYNNVPGAC
jgi:hypothetical protein